MTAIEHGAAAETTNTRTSVLVLDESTLRHSGSLSPKSIMIPTLTFIAGGALGREIPIVKQQVTIGRGEESDIHVVEPSVSRRHVQLCCRKVLGRDGEVSFRVVLRDLGSMNGTLVNYRKVQRAVLKPGDKIFLGKVILKYEHRDLADQDFYGQIYRLATTDNLTSLSNRATITRMLADEMARCVRYSRPLSIVMIDLDRFKSLNDTFGHLVGDRVLQATGRILRRNLRRQDAAGRLGGEEFLVVLPETGVKGAAATAERIRGEIERLIAPPLRLEQAVTASLGVACLSGEAADADRLLDRADSALYRAKTMGRNRVEVWKATPREAGRA